MTWQPISSPAGLLAVLLGVCAFFFFLERATRWRLFHYLPPLIFIYAAPMVLSNWRVLPVALLEGDNTVPLSDGESTHVAMIVNQSPVYDSIGELVLPVMLVLLLLNVDVAAAVRVMGRGVIVMLFGTAGVVVGAPVGYFFVRQWLGPEAWKAFGTLAGSWIGGTGNMAAVAEMIDTDGAEFGLAVLGDTTIYVVWLPILLMSKQPIVAAYHKESLVPAGILMALIGYAIGNYAAYLAALLCRWVAVGAG